MQFAGDNRLGLGTAPLGSIETGPLWWGPQDRDVAVATVAAAVDAGAAFIDTAPSYGWGRAEQIVADGLRGVGDRPPVLTKCATIRGEDGRPVDDASPAAVRQDVEESLDRFGVDRIDVVQVHDPDPVVPIEETWETLMALREEGLIGGAGLSNHSVELMDRALAIGPVVVVQHQYSILYRAPEERGVIDWCRDHSVPFLAWSPLASGFLTDEFDLSPLHPDDLRHRLRWAGDDADLTRRVREAQAAIAEKHGASMVDVALSWATRREGTYAIVGCRSPEEAQVFSRSRVELDVDDVAVLDVAVR